MNVARKKSKISSQPSKTMLNLYSYHVPNVVIVGDKKIRGRSQKIEKRFNLELIFSSPDLLKDSINRKTIAIIVDEEEVRKKSKEYLESLLSKYKFLPIFFLSRSIKRSNFYTDLYGKGLQGVVNWPEESKVLHDFIIESLKPHPHAVGRSKADEKLSEVIKSHLVLQGGYKAIKVKVIEGFAFLEGSVKSLFDKKSIEVEASKVLGVKKTIVKNIKIQEFKSITDRELERKIKMYTENILGDRKKSISIKVRSKVVTIEGAIVSHRDVLDIEEFSMKQPGIKNITRLVEYSPKLVLKNIKKAKLVESKIKFLFDGVRYIAIKIYGDFAEVSGSVRMKEDRTLVEKYLLQTLAIKKVINKIFVA